jgi:hypothetical protein
MKYRVAGMVLLPLIALAAWLFLQTSPASSQVSGGEGTKVGRYVYVSGGLATVVMIDTQTGKTYALAGPGMFGMRDEGDFAWVPITKFEDVPSYRKWLQQRRDEMFNPRFSPTPPTYYKPTATPLPTAPPRFGPSPTPTAATVPPKFRPTASFPPTPPPTVR